MSKKKPPTTIEECNAEMELTQKKIRQYENRNKMLDRKLAIEKRKERNHRLCSRGGYLESLVPALIDMSEQEARDFLYTAVFSDKAQEFLRKRAGEATPKNYPCTQGRTYGSNYNRLKPIHDELKTLKNGWGKKREKFEQAHESDLIIWNAANRFLHANLPEGTKSFKVSEWQKEFDELKAQSTGEYEELKTKRSEVKELQQIRKCIDIVEQAEQRTQEQTHQTPRRKKEDISL